MNEQKLLEWTISATLISLSTIIVWSHQRIIYSYPCGRTREQEKRRAFMIKLLWVASIAIFILLEFSHWLAEWYTLFNPLHHPSWIKQLGIMEFLIPNTSLLLGDLIIIWLVWQAWSQRKSYRQWFGLADFLRKESLQHLSHLSKAKQTAMAERLYWLIEHAHNTPSISEQLKIIFDANELSLLSRLLADDAIEHPKSVLNIIYGEVERQRTKS